MPDPKSKIKGAINAFNNSLSKYILLIINYSSFQYYIKLHLITF